MSEFDESAADIAFLLQLEAIIAERASAKGDESYTARLLAAGTKRIAQKVGEEGVETALAAVAGDRDELMNEAADLVYHLLVLLCDSDVSLADLAQLLEARHRS